MADKRELILDLLSRNKMGPGTAAAAKDLDKVGTAAEAASRSTDKLGKSSDRAGAQTEDLGDSSTQAARKVNKLDDEIRRVNQDLVLLAGQLADADDAAGRMDISRGIRKSQADLKRMTSAKGLLENLLPDPQPAARSFMAKLGGGIVAGGAGVAGMAGKHVGPVIGIAVGAAAAPIVVSTISAALSAGAGSVGIGAGVALAVSKDKDLQQAGAYAGKRFADGLGKSAVTAYRQPILTAVGVLSKAGDQISARWGKVFASTSGMLVPFVQDIATAGTRISESLAGAAERSAPAMAALGDSIVLVSDAVGDTIDILSSGSQGAADNLILVAGALGDVVRMQGVFLNGLSDLASNPWITGPLIPLLREHYKGAADDSESLSTASQYLANSFTDAQRAAQGQLDAMVGLSNEMKAQTDPAFALLNAQDKVRDSQDKLSDSIKKHGKNSKEARAATRDLAGAAIDLQGKAGALGDTFDGNLTPAMYNTLRSAGLTKAQIAGVEREMRDAKRAGGEYAKNYRASVSVTGAAAARRSLYSVKDIADDIPRAVTIAMRITGVSNVSAAAAAVRKNARAAGGPVTRGIPYLVGEEGPEMIVPEAAGRVLSAAATRGAVRGSSAGGMPTTMVGGGGVPGGGWVVRHELVGPEEMRVFFRKMIRTMSILPETESVA